MGHGALPADDARPARLVRAWQHLEAIKPLLAGLEREGIACVGFRGPFAAMDLYDDLAARAFGDVDLIVPRKDRWNALRAAEACGFALRRPEARGFIARHHLHWPMVHRASGVLLDLHWAIDHPYTLLAVDYDALFRRAERRAWEGFAWLQPCPEHLYLLARFHAAKHGRDPGAEPDVARIEAKYGPAMDWRDVEKTEGAWRLRACGQAAGARPAPAWLVRLGRAAGFRPERALDVRGYVWPAAAHFAPARGPALAMRRAGHAVRASARLGFALLDGLILARRLAAVALLAAALPAQAVCPAYDDHADAPVSATYIAGTNSVGGAIGRDTDEDWFRFSALPGTTYRIALSTTTVWDATVALRAPDGATLLVLTNTAAASPAQAYFTNGNTIGSFYLQVGGYLEFTTGAYAMTVSPQNFTDADGDGMSDAWETNYFGSTTNGAAGDVDGDGLGNLAEFYAGSSPGSASSGLLIDEIALTGAAARVTWQSGLYGTYRVLTAAGLEPPQAWSVLGTNINLDGSPLDSFLDAGAGATARLYRIELVY